MNTRNFLKLATRNFIMVCIHRLYLTN